MDMLKFGRVGEVSEVSEVSKMWTASFKPVSLSNSCLALPHDRVSCCISTLQR